MTCWECQGVGVGLDEETLLSLRREDEQMFPTEDVGVFVWANIVWATKTTR